MTTSAETHVDTVVIGAGIVGIAVAYYLVTRHGVKNIVLVDPFDPMSLTSAQSGENYRNWWPHPVMTAYTNHSIDLLEEIASASGSQIDSKARNGVPRIRSAAQSERIGRSVDLRSPTCKWSFGR